MSSDTAKHRELLRALKDAQGKADGSFEQAVVVNTAAEMESHQTSAELQRQQKAIKDAAKEKKAFAEWRVKDETAGEAKVDSSDSLGMLIQQNKKKSTTNDGKNAARKASTVNPAKPTGMQGQSPTQRNRGGGGGGGGGGGWGR